MSSGPCAAQKQITSRAPRVFFRSKSGAKKSIDFEAARFQLERMDCSRRCFGRRNRGNHNFTIERFKVNTPNNFIVLRKPGAEYGAGIATIEAQDGHLLARGPVITGKKSAPAATEYGGVTPPGIWFPVETLEKRDHPRGESFTFSRILPAEDQRMTHKARTYGIAINDPFMVHYGGRSTGCVCILPEWWDYGVDTFNRCFSEGLTIEIVDDPTVDLDEFSAAFEAYAKKYD